MEHNKIDKELTKDCKHALKSYINYWDEWHKYWWQTKKTILDWPMPFSNYFPEPYWGNPFAERLSAVFLNYVTVRRF